VKRALLAVVAVALVLAVPAAARLPVYENGSSVGEGLPFKAYATITPTVHLFGDSVTAKIAIVADTKLVDPSRLQVRAQFAPYVQTREPTILRVSIGRFAQLTWTWTLECLTSPCVPRDPPSDKFHVFSFHPARITYLRHLTTLRAPRSRQLRTAALLRGIFTAVQARAPERAASRCADFVARSARFARDVLADAPVRD
jgi:hypothetical protein